MGSTLADVTKLDYELSLLPSLTKVAESVSILPNNVQKEANELSRLIMQDITRILDLKADSS